jgi:ubiquinone biosynthesis protein
MMEVMASPPAPAPTSPRPPIGRLRLFMRALTIALLALQHLVRWLLGWTWMVVTFAGRDRRRAWMGAVIADLFRSLGATFVKVGQILSTRPDLVPGYIRLALERLQDDVGPFPFAAVAQIIEEDLGRRPDEIFADLVPVPIASASVSQVHKARLPDGQVVAIKVRRPDVIEICSFDLAVMRLCAGVIARLPTLGPLEPEAVIAEFGRAIFAQLDFRIEAGNNRRFRANFHGHPDVLFPQVIEALSTERILCMGFIEGTKILSVDRTLSDPKRIARIGLETMLKMIFEDGFVHADLHPGNILITPEQKIAMLDLGLIGELDPPHRRSFARFFAAWSQRDGDSMARLMYAMSSADPADVPAFERFRASIIEFVGRYWGQRMGEIQVGKVLFDVLGILRRHRLRMNPAFTVVNIAIAVTEGIGKQLDPELDLMAVALPYFIAHPIEAEAV